MTSTPRLALPYLAPNQAQKHVTLNESLRRLDMLVQLAAESRAVSAPPAEPAAGECWIVGEAASGIWEGHAGEIAGWQDGAWAFAEPQPGWVAYVLDEDALVVWKDGAWGGAVAAPEVLQQLLLLGVGTEADAENPFAAKLNKVLWTALGTGEGGDGDLRYTLNKEAAGNTLSLLMQSGWSGRAEIGLVGNDDLSVKVSDDGTDWKEALVVDRETGAARFPYGLVHPVSGAPLSNLIFTPGGDGAVSLFRIDAARSQNPRTATVSSVSGDTITLTSAVAAQFFDNARMSGVVMVRIWNTSKTAPGEPAWVVAAPAGNQLRVRDAAEIAGWTNGETLQIGDPAPAVTPTRAVALDISPMLQNVLGAVFPQQGVLMKFGSAGSGGPVGMAVSGTAASGSFSGVSSLSTGGFNGGIIITSTTTPSPVSNSNLVYVREDDGDNTLGATLLTMVGVYV